MGASSGSYLGTWVHVDTHRDSLFPPILQYIPPPTLPDSTHTHTLNTRQSTFCSPRLSSVCLFISLRPITIHDGLKSQVISHLLLSQYPAEQYRSIDNINTFTHTGLHLPRHYITPVDTEPEHRLLEGKASTSLTYVHEPAPSEAIFLAKGDFFDSIPQEEITENNSDLSATGADSTTFQHPPLPLSPGPLRFRR